MNEPFKILIVEDEFTIALNLKSILENAGHIVLEPVDSFKKCVDTCKDGLPDLILMDIEIKGEHDGIESASMIKDMFGLPIVFITAFSQNEIFDRAKKIKPEGYITKPFVKDDLLRTVELCKEKKESNQPENTSTLILNSGDGWVKVNFDDLLYIMSDNNYCTLFLENEKPLLINITLKAIEQKLPQNDFFRCHHSYMISMKKLKKIERKEGYFAILTNDIKVPISRAKRTIMLEKFKHYFS